MRWSQAILEEDAERNRIQAPGLVLNGHLVLTLLVSRIVSGEDLVTRGQAERNLRIRSVLQSLSLATK